MHYTGLRRKQHHICFQDKCNTLIKTPIHIITFHKSSSNVVITSSTNRAEPAALLHCKRDTNRSANRGKSCTTPYECKEGRHNCIAMIYATIPIDHSFVLVSRIRTFFFEDCCYLFYFKTVVYFSWRFSGLMTMLCTCDQ